ncbi:MAG: hypothetical protein FJ279_03050 [Planctomycetes bacterium]|nr:hypothetical protein [Planctomycetota bacterium]MBM4081876.1 hypothetical protein [Planctomycetota bacterium]
MNHRHAALWVLALVLLGGGCASVGPTVPLEETEDWKGLLDLFQKFEKAVNADDTAAIMALFSPKLAQEALHDQKWLIEESVLSRRYSDYKLFYEEALGRMSDSRIAGGRLKFFIRFANRNGSKESDRFDLVREGDKWYFLRVLFESPVFGTELDLPAAEREELLTSTERYLKALQKNDMGVLVYGLWEKLPPPDDRTQRALIAKFGELLQFHFLGSSYSREQARIEYVSPHKVQVPVQFLYKTSAFDDSRGRKLFIAFVYLKDPEGWMLVDIRVGSET